MSGGCAQKSTPDINLNITKNPVILWPALIDFDIWKSSRHNNSFTLLRHQFFNPSHHNWSQATQPQRRFMTKLTSTKEQINESVFFSSFDECGVLSCENILGEVGVPKARWPRYLKLYLYSFIHSSNF